MVDFNINLAKSMTSTPEERQRFYNRMLIYFAICAAALVGVAYLTSRNIIDIVKTDKERKMVLATMTSVSEYGKSFFRNPALAYNEFNAYAADLETLKKLLEQRPQFLPVMSELFSGFPKNIALQSIKATVSEDNRGNDDKYIEFVLVAPVIDDNGKDVLRTMQAKWRDNAALQRRANSVTQLNNERNMVGDTLMATVKYRCVLK